MDEKLILNDGTEYTGHCIETETRLFLYIYDEMLLNVAEMLSDAEKVERISWERNGQTGAVDGYKTLMSVSVENEQMISASLKK